MFKKYEFLLKKLNIKNIDKKIYITFIIKTLKILKL